MTVTSTGKGPLALICLSIIIFVCQLAWPKCSDKMGFKDSKDLRGHMQSETKARKVNFNGGLRYPDFVIAGVKKCGTEALALVLSKHPQTKRQGQSFLS